MKGFNIYVPFLLMISLASIAHAGPFDKLKNKVQEKIGSQGEKQLIKAVAQQLSEGAPIVPSGDSLFPTVTTLPGAEFKPSERVQSVVQQLASSQDGSVLMQPGDYSIPVTLYCMKQSASSPPGHRYLLAPLKGKQVAAITALNSRAPKARLPYATIQVLSWNLQAGRKYDELSKDQRKIVDDLLPEYKQSISRNQLEAVIATYNKFAPAIGFPSFQQALEEGKLGEVGKTLLGIQQFQSTLANSTDNGSLVRLSIPPSPPSNQRGGPENTPWSRISPQVYGRMFTFGNAGSTGQLQFRVLASPNQPQGINVPLTSLVSDPQNVWIQPLTMSPQPEDEKPDLTCKIVKWENIIPGIVGWPANTQLASSEQREVDNGWAVNLTAVVTLTISNSGAADAPGSNVTIKLKKGDDVAQLNDVAVEPLRAGESKSISVKLQFGQTQNWNFIGDAAILAEIDAGNGITESSEDNNISTHDILLADPRPDRTLDKVFPTRNVAVAYLTQLGFIEDNVFHLQAVGWAKYLSGQKIRSRRDGKLKDARDFRQDAVIVTYPSTSAYPAGGFAVAFQGTASFGEPNPKYFEDWFPHVDYVRWWHVTANY